MKLILTLCLFATISSALGSELKWTGKNGDICGVFKKDGSFLRAMNKASCMGPRLTFYQWTDSESKNCVGYNACGVRLGEASQSHCKGKANPFAKAWPKQGFTWKKCITPKIGDTESKYRDVLIYGGTTAPFDKHGEFVPECAPDVLYSWTMPAFIASYVSGNSPESLLDLGASKTRLYGWRTPIGSFGFGRDSIRMKVRSTAKFILHKDILNDRLQEEDCKILKEKYGRNTVYVNRTEDSFSEYFVCSDEPIESWSYHTNHHFAEMNEDLAYITQHDKDHEYDSLIRSNSKSSGLPWTFTLDSSTKTVNWSRDSLNKDLSAIYNNIQNKKGAIFFAKDVVPSVWNHFATRNPGYFNSYDISKEKDVWPERDADGCKILPVNIDHSQSSGLNAFKP